MKIFDFLNILALLSIFCGVIVFVDWIFRKKSQNKNGQTKHTTIVDYARSFFPVFLIVLLIRAFIAQPYRVPTGSLEPTVIPGDLILVTQYNYGLKVPIWDKVIFPIGKPQTGQIALFRWPVNPKVTFVKRVIGVPGDHISYVNKVLSINGKEATRKLIGDAKEIMAGDKTRMVKKYEENLNGVKHFIYVNPKIKVQDFKDLVVPKGMYFMMGDNRDDSDDSRDWGFVPVANYIGRARIVWMNWDSSKYRVRWDRIGTRL
jgi:signal peptidase I